MGQAPQERYPCGSGAANAMPTKITVLISGTGSNLKAIQSSIERGQCDATIVAVIADRRKAAGLEFAREAGLETAVLRPRDFPDRDAWNAALLETVASFNPDIVVLAGFMRIVGPAFVQRFAGRVLNVHPALLPAFPGTDGPAQALAAKVRVTGCTVHVVDEGVDTGPIVAQAVVRVLQDDDAESLHKRIQTAEHVLLPHVIASVARGTIVLGKQPLVGTASEDSELFFSPPLRDPV